MVNAEDRPAAEQPENPPTEDGSAPLMSVTGLSEAETRQAFRWFFFLAFGLLLYQILRILSLFSDAIIWASSLALVFFPAHKMLQARFPKRPTLTATVSTTFVLLLVLVPIFLVGRMVVEQSAQVYPTVRGWVAELESLEPGSAESLLPEIVRDYWTRFNDYLVNNRFLSRIDLETFVLNNVQSASGTIADFSAATARNVLLVVLNLILIVFGMFFCFRDGDRFLSWLLDVIPMPTAQFKAIGTRVYQTITAIIRGALVTAAVQGALAMLGYIIAGVPLAVFFGVLTGFAAMIPVIGAGLIWFPIAVFVLTESIGWGIFLIVWGFFLVSLIDNFLRPILIGAGARIPILLVFLSVIGGANIYGFTGLIIGPILIACMLAFFSIYREHYATHEPIERSTPP